MKHIKPAVLPFFLLLAGLILTELLIMNRDLRTRTACAVAGRGMLSLVQQTMEEPPRVALTFDDDLTPSILLCCWKDCERETSLLPSFW